jgi:hypothetical protein
MNVETLASIGGGWDDNHGCDNSQHLTVCRTIMMTGIVE